MQIAAVFSCPNQGPNQGETAMASLSAALSVVPWELVARVALVVLDYLV
ncbi:hypothetical protein [Nocardia sp. CA-290969]